ncbi:MAG: nitrous oxide reductase accessory protein NosL [Gammaproteobacteria bacterium]|nr:nitrous oxide reductase accessory protein NosL [Gammaproteobacteria bacterium]
MIPIAFSSWLTLFSALILSLAVTAAPLDLPPPAADATCPVCGMFVAKYPEWIATVEYLDGHLHHFDGAKDLFKYLQNLQHWAPGHRLEDIRAIGVTEYYGLTLIDARSAYFVLGSDLLGPMGHELIPFVSEEEAAEFLKDHHGKRIVVFNEVTPALISTLD